MVLNTTNTCDAKPFVDRYVVNIEIRKSKLQRCQDVEQSKAPERLGCDLVRSVAGKWHVGMGTTLYCPLRNLEYPFISSGRIKFRSQ